MLRLAFLALFSTISSLNLFAQEAAKPAHDPSTQAAQPPADSVTEGAITIDGQRMRYRAIAGTIVVGSSDPQDATLTADGRQTSDSSADLPAKPQDRPATARMFYAAYLRLDSKQDPANRPVTFIYNGGPGSPTMYLHLGAFGPRRVILHDLEHPSGGPYRLADNPYTLLDASDLIFIDAPGAGYSRVEGRDAAKAFYGVDEDAQAFSRFIRKWLSKNNRWTSPRFLFGESYGTTRSAVLANNLASIDLNGVVLLSQILNFNDSADGPQAYPGTDEPYFLSLPSFAATAWFHHRLTTPSLQLEPFLHEVEQFALTDYAAALHAGADLPADRKQAIAASLAGYTGVPAATWLKADLRLSGAEFSALLQTDNSITTGRLDTRFEGPALDPLATDAAYDPFSAATSPSFLNAMNQYAHTELMYGQDLVYKPTAREPGFHWNNEHHGPTAAGWEGPLNVMPDLASAMKRNPHLHVLLMGGYFDVGTLYFGAEYEMKHLPVPANLQGNISYHWFPTGHMVYVQEASAKALHDATAAFIRANSTGQ